MYIVAIALLFLSVYNARSEETKLETYRCVVTFHLLPAKVMKIK